MKLAAANYAFCRYAILDECAQAFLTGHLGLHLRHALLQRTIQLLKPLLQRDVGFAAIAELANRAEIASLQTESQLSASWIIAARFHCGLLEASRDK